MAVTILKQYVDGLSTINTAVSQLSTGADQLATDTQQLQDKLATASAGLSAAQNATVTNSATLTVDLISIAASAQTILQNSSAGTNTDSAQKILQSVQNL